MGEPQSAAAGQPTVFFGGGDKIAGHMPVPKAPIPWHELFGEPGLRPEGISPGFGGGWDVLNAGADANDSPPYLRLPEPVASALCFAQAVKWIWAQAKSITYSTIDLPAGYEKFRSYLGMDGTASPYIWDAEDPERAVFELCKALIAARVPA